MALVHNIWDSYRRPQAFFDRLTQQEHAEKTALGFLATGCALAFISRWPDLARQSHLTEQPLDMMLGGALFGWIFVAPILLYALGGLLTLVMSLLGAKACGPQVRIALFWSFLATGPLLLIYGLLGGFLGQGAVTRLIGVMWLAFFGYFLYCGFRAIRRSAV